MKRLFLSLGAFALLGLSSCVDRIEVNPNYDPDTKEVFANFIFNVATSDSPSTKMTGDVVQADVDGAAKFRGINNGHIFALILGSSNTNKTAVGSEVAIGNSTTTGIKKVFELDEIITAGTLSGSGAAGTNQSKSHRVLELNVPTGVNNFLFYGKAIRDAGKTNDEQGFISFNVDHSSLGDTHFDLQPRLSSESDLTTYRETQTLIAKVLTNILCNPTVSLDGNTTLHWKDFATYDSQAARGSRFTPVTSSALGEVVGELFCNFVNIPSGSVRAGAGQSVVRTIGDMAVSIGQVAKALPTDPEEQKAALMAREIIKEMDRFFYITTPTSASVPENYNDNSFNPLWTQASENDPKVYNFSYVNTDSEDVRWRLADDIKRELSESNYSTVSLESIRFFPTYFNMPVGVAQLTIDEGTLVVSYADKPGAFNNNEQGIDIKKVMYPAELCYFGNSPIRVTNDVLDAADFPDGSGDGTNEWLNATSWAGWGDRGGEVISTTKSIAMCDNINYGTALLKVTVGYTNISATTPLVDNSGKSTSTNGNGAFFPEESPKISYDAAPDNLFYLTGILVGGQYQTVGWNFIKKSSVAKDYVVYDKIIDPFRGEHASAIAVKGGTAVSDANYTLLWDNYNGSDDTQDEVLVALEFVNNSGTDFWGENNIIRKGGTFYLVGKLIIPSEATSSFEWPANNDKYALPPYGEDGNTIKRERVFVQDYMTIADFKIGPKSLRHAYLTVPDLRSSQLSLGLSVDLKWRTGRTYSYILGE